MLCIPSFLEPFLNHVPQPASTRPGLGFPKSATNATGRWEMVWNCPLHHLQAPSAPTIWGTVGAELCPGVSCECGFLCSKGKQPHVLPMPHIQQQGWLHIPTCASAHSVPRTAEMDYGPEQLLTTRIFPLQWDSTLLFYQFCMTSF